MSQLQASVSPPAAQHRAHVQRTVHRSELRDAPWLTSRTASSSRTLQLYPLRCAPVRLGLPDVDPETRTPQHGIQEGVPPGRPAAQGRKEGMSASARSQGALEVYQCKTAELSQSWGHLSLATGPPVRLQTPGHFWLCRKCAGNSSARVASEGGCGWWPLEVMHWEAGGWADN